MNKYITFLLFALLAVAESAAINNPFAPLDTYPNVVSTYASGNLLSPDQRTAYNSRNFGKLEFSEPISALWVYNCNDRTSVREALNLLEKYKKENPGLKLDARNKNGESYTDLYSVRPALDPDGNTYEMLMIFGYYSGTQVQISVIEFAKPTEACNTRGPMKSYGSPGSVTVIPAPSNNVASINPRNSFSSKRISQGNVSPKSSGHNSCEYRLSDSAQTLLSYLNADVTVEAGDRNAIIVTGDEYATGGISVNEDRRTVTVNADGPASGDAVIRIITKTITEFFAMEPGCLSISGIGSGNKAVFSVCGPGDIIVSGKVDIPNIEATIVGSGDIVLAGPLNCNRFMTISQGSGEISAQSVKADNAEVNSSGSGDIEVTKLDAKSLTVISQGSGDVKVGGRAGQAVLMASGSGNINARGLKANKVTRNAQPPAEILSMAR